MNINDEIIKELVETIAQVHNGRFLDSDEVRSTIRGIQSNGEPDSELVWKVYHAYRNKFPDNRYPEENMNWEFQ